MEQLPLGNDRDEREMNELLGLFDLPAYMRRARGVEDALEFVLTAGQKRREEWLEMPRLRLGQLSALIGGDWSVLRPWLADDLQIEVLLQLHELLVPKLRVPLERSSSKSEHRRALVELIASLERFNRRWSEYLDRVDLSEINTLREGYNRYYVIEKACALRSDLLARASFTPLLPLTREDLERRLPLLNVPRVRADG